MRHVRAKLSALFLCYTLGGCGLTPQEAGVVGAIAGGGSTYFTTHTVTGEVYQVYYLGVFDPINQISPTFYRITVRGQSNLFSDMKFASGWVPAESIDTLTSKVEMTNQGLNVDANGGAQITSARRKFVLMGPEGVREGPENHRLVIVMGSSPHNFFSAIDSAMGELLSFEQTKAHDPVNRMLMEELLSIAQERQLLEGFCRNSTSLCTEGAE
ncbi:hypothetical protein [Pseudoalteromonas luteoviolacea]|uniref:hypothetical protein n=1 Tax=Pseudoalteromonas luteoviolacea TaxID=43657 RepID=UPI0007B0508C|nr:hypothetical protein [Pseudoalteromonas luteoviolacea]KZN52816.1 hypothetical protein N474_22340 [Pseudoalteromonas luteoviolacea CPMOR-2]TQF67844.1 hypothetical protein FLM44_21940 [Pseudoalteromonas luteoviolacea]